MFKARLEDKMWETRHYKARLEEAKETLKMSGCVPPHE